MDERLQKALEFSNYSLTITNQKKNIKNRINQLRIVHHDNGVFFADEATIGFVKTLIDLGNKQSVLIDTKENPVEVKSLNDLLENLTSAYFSATNELNAEYLAIKKQRTVTKLMDW